MTNRCLTKEIKHKNRVNRQHLLTNLSTLDPRDKYKRKVIKVPTESRTIINFRFEKTHAKDDKVAICISLLQTMKHGH